jgi:uncharacterized protein
MERSSDAVPASPAGVPASGEGGGPVLPTGAAFGRWRPLGLREVTLAEGSALGDWQRRNTAKTIPHCTQEVAASGALRNLERVSAGDRGSGAHEGMPFSDSDIYKVLEAAAWDSVRGTSAQVAGFISESTGLMERAQRDDGYLNSWAQSQAGNLIWKDFRWGHELYCAGHLLQAAVATHRTGGESALTEVTGRFVEHLLGTFSRHDGDGGLRRVCGHPLIETALVEYYRVTGKAAVLELAQRFVDLRGRADVPLPASGLLGDNRFVLSYFLHHTPVRTRRLATGHAVRELYLQAGVVDVATETGDQELLGASEAIWDDLYGTKTYITGAHGSRHRDESIGDAYELPSDRAYGETCAAIASFQWNWRLLLATGRARYAEAMERVFWNTIAGGVSQEGTEFFYSNTLQLRTGHDNADEDSPRHRLRWYQCACCPPNLARLLASVQSYLVTQDSSGLQVHMPFSGTISTLASGAPVELRWRTGHPWDGTTEMEVARCEPGSQWDLSLRAPEWAAQESLRLTVNGDAVGPSWDGPYMTVTRRWHPGDRLQLSQRVPVRVMRPHWRADAVRDCVAVERGPLVYCLEAADLPAEVVVEDAALDLGRPLEPTSHVPAELGTFVKVAIGASGALVDGSSGRLYDAPGTAAPGRDPASLTLVPYFARANRPEAAMRVWLPMAPGLVRPEATGHESEVGR